MPGVAINDTEVNKRGAETCPRERKNLEGKQTWDKFAGYWEYVTGRSKPMWGILERITFELRNEALSLVKAGTGGSFQAEGTAGGKVLSLERACQF